MEKQNTCNTNGTGKNASYFLGVDWGGRYCGLALADDETCLAFAWKRIRRKDFTKALKEAQNKFLLKAVVVGAFFSREAGDKFGRKNQLEIKKLVEEAKGEGMKIYFQEEAFSTLAAQKNLQQVNKSAKENDAEAARIILQSWLDKSKKKC
jgi:RNase H-fold protein (predicted Holliday junction resolvase)